MGSVDLGTVVEVAWDTVPEGGAPALSLVRPDGSTQIVPTVTMLTGTSFKASFSASMAGRWQIRWISTGAVAAYTDVLDVWPADPRFIISLDDARNALNIRAGLADASTMDDLRLYVAAATPVIEDITGPIVSGIFTQVADGGHWAITLNDIPSEILSVTELDVPLTDYVADLQAGIIYAGRRYALRQFMPGFNSVVIQYRAGSAVIPPNIRLAARELIRHWWQIGKQARDGGSSFSQTGDAFTPSGYAVPRRVIELCAAHERLGGFA